jgi:polyphosphate glucokinase
MRALGIDIGGSGIKGAIVNLKTGALSSQRYRVPTPQPSTPKAMARAVARVVRHFAWKGPVACGMPGPIKQGRLLAMANLHKSWVGVRAEEVFGKTCGTPVSVINDADAAGLAEMRFGAGRKASGVVILVTLGTGIGTALFIDGTLVPNTELGHLELRGKSAELRTAARIRKEKDLSWEKWGKRLDEYLRRIEFLFSPDLIIIGGGVSRKAAKFLPFITTKVPVVPAQFRNEAGIVGAALSAVRRPGR